MRRRGSIVTRQLNDPFVVGLLIIAAGVAALILSYSAQRGLPWQQSYDVRVHVPRAAQLSKHADVRIGGARVGQVLRIAAVPRAGAVPPHALLDVRIDGDAGPLPVDSSAEVRLASVLGGKYLALTPGRSRTTIPADGELALTNARASIDLDEAFTVFRPAGRRALRAVVGRLADTVAGRGTTVNQAIGDAAALLPGLQRVLAAINARRTDLPGFVAGLAATTGVLAALGPTLESFVGNAARTFAALDNAGDALGRSVAELPATAGAATGALRTLKPVLDDAVAIARDLHPAGAVLRRNAQRSSALLRTAIRADPAFATLARPLDATLDAVGELAADPAPVRALKVLGRTDLATFGGSAFIGLGAILRTAWEAEQHCRVISDWAGRLAGVTSEGDSGGNWLRMLPVLQLEEMLPATRPAARLHANPYPNENARECEAGNEGYAPGQLIGNPGGNQGAR